MFFLADCSNVSEYSIFVYLCETYCVIHHSAHVVFLKNPLDMLLIYVSLQLENYGFFWAIW